MTDESALKDIVDALGERIFSLEGDEDDEDDGDGDGEGDDDGLQVPPLRVEGSASKCLRPASPHI